MYELESQEINVHSSVKREVGEFARLPLRTAYKFICIVIETK